MRMSESRILRIMYESKRKRRSDWWINKIKSLFVLLCVVIVFLQLNSPTGAQAVLLLKILGHTHTHTHTRQDSSGRLIIWSHRPLPAQLTANTSDEHSFPHGDSKRHSQQSDLCTPTPYIARPQGSSSAILVLILIQGVSYCIPGLQTFITRKPKDPR